jgi:hypothetical protein
MPNVTGHFLALVADTPLCVATVGVHLVLLVLRSTSSTRLLSAPALMNDDLLQNNPNKYNDAPSVKMAV